MTREQRIIRKAVDELGKEAPDLSYVRGMLESLVEEDEVRIINGQKVPVGMVLNVAETERWVGGNGVDDAAALEAQAASMLKSMPPLEA